MSNFDKDSGIKMFTIITLGHTGVGKTSIIRRFAYNEFGNFKPTLGFYTVAKDIVLKNGTKIKIKLINTSGQENYQVLSTTYVKSADGVLFVFSHDNKQSFEDIKIRLNNLKKDFGEINFEKETPSFLVGNKCDLDHIIDKSEIEKLKNENNFFGYKDTSAKENIGIDSLFYEMG